jgi:FkbM family methyltransferase
VAKATLRVPLLEEGLRAICRRPVLARLSRAGAIAVAYPDVIRGSEMRTVQAKGFKLIVNLAEHRGARAYFFQEPRPSWLLDHLVRPGSKCVDAGANVGLYTCGLARLVGSEGLVIAIEPHPTAAALLRSSVAANGFEDRVVIEQLALNRAGVSQTPLFLYQESELASTVVESDHHIWVPAATLDDIVGRQRIDGINFAKVDVERAEEQVLAGAEQLLSKGAIDCILIELLAHEPAHCLLRSYSYTGFLVLNDPPRLVQADQVPRGRFGDYLFVAPARLPEVLRTAATCARVE